MRRVLLIALFCLLPSLSFGATLATDTFSAGSGNVSSDWTVISGFELPQQNSGVAQPKTVAVGGLALNTSISWPANQCAEMPIVTATGVGRFPGVILRGVVGARTNYQVDIQGPLGAATAITIRKYTAGSATTLSGGTASMSSGSVLKGCIFGSTITAYVNGTPLFATTDATIATGSPGFTVYTQTGLVTNAQVGTWTGSDSSDSGLPAGSCGGSGAVWSCTDGASTSSLQAALDVADDGAVFTFAAGTYTGGGINILTNIHGVTLQCASVGACTFTTPSTTLFTYGNCGTDRTNLIRVTGFNFTGANPATGHFFLLCLDKKNITKLRIDHNDFSTGTAIVLGETSTGLYTGQIYGVIDHNVCHGATNFVCFQNYAGGNQAWTTGTQGTANAMFFEDNQCTFTVMGNTGAACVDDSKANSTVTRFNDVFNSRLGHHSYCFGGPMSTEVYGNFVDYDSNSPLLGFRSYHSQGSGEELYWMNKATKHAGGVTFTIQGHRSDPASATSEGTCNSLADGTVTGTGADPAHANDGNRSPTGTYFGYPVWHQSGRDGAATLKPVYLWGNVDESANLLPYAAGSAGYFTTNHFLANRDYYEAVSKNAQTSSSSPFDGTTGMGFGILARRPATCTPTGEALDAGNGGVGYFATDQGSWNTSASNPYGVNFAGADGLLYRCSATNTWTLAYTPYTYPHPLQLEGDPGGPPVPIAIGTTNMALYHTATMAIFQWPASVDANHKAYKVYLCTTSVNPCLNLIATITPASAALAHQPENRYVHNSLYVAATYYFSVADQNTSDYIGPTGTPVSVTVTGKP